MTNAEIYSFALRFCVAVCEYKNDVFTQENASDYETTQDDTTNAATRAKIDRHFAFLSVADNRILASLADDERRELVRYCERTQTMIDEYASDIDLTMSDAKRRELFAMSDAERSAFARDYFKSSEAKVSDDELADADANALAFLLASSLRFRLFVRVALRAIADAANDASMLEQTQNELRESDDERLADAKSLARVALLISAYRYVYDLDCDDADASRLHVKNDAEREQANSVIDYYLRKRTH